MNEPRKTLRSDRGKARGKATSEEGYFKNPTALREALQQRFSPDLADALEEKVVIAAEYYETLVDDVEQEKYPLIAKRINQARKAIEHTRTFKIYLSRNCPSWSSVLQKIEDQAKEYTKQFPARKRFKTRGRAPTMALTIARFLDDHGVPLDAKESGDLAFAIETIFKALRIPCVNPGRRLIPKALKELAARKTFKQEVKANLQGRQMASPRPPAVKKTSTRAAP